MRKEKTGKLKEKLWLGVFTLMLVATFGLSGVFVSYASQAKVTARNGANIRKEASTSSDKVGGVKQGEVLNIISTVKGADGKDWYQVSYNNLSGYVRSDLVTLTEGSTPPADGNGGDSNDPPADVRPLNPVSATVTRDSGRVRSYPSVSSAIVSEVPFGLVLTVTGDVTDSDGSVWYQVNYNSGDGSQVNGYIRSDYVTLAADATPATDTPPDSQEPPQDPVTPDKPYDTILYDGEWHLMDTSTNEAYKIEALFAATDTANTNAKLYDELAKSEKSQKIIIIILVFLLVAAVAGIAFLVFKIKDMMDAAYFSEVENDALRKRKSASQGGSQKVMHTVNSEGQQGRSPGARQSGASQGQRAQGSGQRTAGTSQGQKMQGAGQAQRPVGASQGQRMSGGMSQGQRVQGSGQDQRMQNSGQGQRMQGSGQGQRVQGSGQGQRMQGSGQSQRMQDSDQEQRMQRSGQRGSGNMQYESLGQEQRQGSQGQRGTGAGQRPMGAPQGARPVQSAQEGAQRAQRRNEEQGWQSKNFMAEEEEEFDLEFLNYDEEQ